MRGEEQRSEVRGNGQEAQTDKKVRKRKIESQKKFKRLKKSVGEKCACNSVD